MKQITLEKINEILKSCNSYYSSWIKFQNFCLGLPLLEPEKKVSHWAIVETHVLLGEKHDRIIGEYVHGQTLI